MLAVARWSPKPEAWVRILHGVQILKSYIMKTYYPWDGRKFNPVKQKLLKEFWDNLTEDERNLVGELMGYSENSALQFEQEYKNYR